MSSRTPGNWKLAVVAAAMALVLVMVGGVGLAVVVGPPAYDVLSLAALLFAFVGTVAMVGWSFVSHRRAVERLRREGARCAALVKSYRRVSMTQHRVLFAIDHPRGVFGCEYMLSGLDEGWLAHVCALQQPVQVIAEPDAPTILFPS